MTTKIQIRRGLAATWLSSNPILSSGEIGFETDTNKIKIGNGSSNWTQLNYFSDIVSASSSLVSYIDQRVGSVIDNAPDLLNTLNELAAALGDNPDVLSTFITSNTASTIYLTKTSASSTYLTQAAGLTAASASATYLTQSAGLTASSASATYLTQANASAQYVSISAGGQEYIQDSIQGLFVHGSHTNINATYDDLNNKIIMTASAATFTGTTDDITEGSTKLFFTNQRSVSAGSTTYALLGMASPSGGLAGQILSKSSSANYDTIWIDRETNIISPLLLMGA